MKTKNANKKLIMFDVMCCFNEMTLNEPKNKLIKTWVEERTNSEQIYRYYLNKKQVDKIIKILCNKI